MKGKTRKLIRIATKGSGEIKTAARLEIQRRADSGRDPVAAEVGFIRNAKIRKG